jgi:hypothetical protein
MSPVRILGKCVIVFPMKARLKPRGLISERKVGGDSAGVEEAAEKG